METWSLALSKTEHNYNIIMNNTETIKNIIINTCKRCNGSVFYHVMIDGREAGVHMVGSRCIVEAPHITFYVDEITSADFECEEFALASFFIEGRGCYDLDITKDMTPQQIIDELA